MVHLGIWCTLWIITCNINKIYLTGKFVNYFNLLKYSDNCGLPTQGHSYSDRWEKSVDENWNSLIDQRCVFNREICGNF